MPVSGDAWLAARSAGLTTAQVTRTAAALADTPQLATRVGRDALVAALGDAVRNVPRADEPDHDMLNLLSAVLSGQAFPDLFDALLKMATNEEERIAAAIVRHRWEIQVRVIPLLDSLKQTSSIDVRGALAQTVCGIPTDIGDPDVALSSSPT